MNFRNTRLAVSLPATDLERAKQFYSDKLGLRPMEVSAPATMAFVAGDGTLLNVYEREQGTKADHTAAIFMVEDVPQAVKSLREKGVRIEQYDTPNLKTDERGIATLGEEQVAWFKDTEGNILAVSTAPS